MVGAFMHPKCSWQFTIIGKIILGVIKKLLLEDFKAESFIGGIKATLVERVNVKTQDCIKHARSDWNHHAKTPA